MKHLDNLAQYITHSHNAALKGDSIYTLFQNNVGVGKGMYHLPLLIKWRSKNIFTQNQCQKPICLPKTTENKPKKGENVCPGLVFPKKKKYSVREKRAKETGSPLTAQDKGWEQGPCSCVLDCGLVVSFLCDTATPARHRDNGTMQVSLPHPGPGFVSLSISSLFTGGGLLPITVKQQESIRTRHGSYQELGE